MDPTANLEEQRQLCKMIEDGTYNDPSAPSCMRVDAETMILRLSELVIALDEWLSSGGFLPEQWSK